MIRMTLVMAVVEALIALAALGSAGCVAARIRRQSSIVSALLWAAALTATCAALFTWLAVAGVLLGAVLSVLNLALVTVGPWWLLGATAGASILVMFLLIRRYA
jgi:hypothetical protein